MTITAATRPCPRAGSPLHTKKLIALLVETMSWMSRFPLSFVGQSRSPALYRDQQPSFRALALDLEPAAAQPVNHINSGMNVFDFLTRKTSNQGRAIDRIVERFTVWLLFLVFLALCFNTATEPIWTASALDMTANVLFSFSLLALITPVVLSMRTVVLKDLMRWEKLFIWIFWAGLYVVIFGLKNASVASDLLFRATD